MKSPRKATTAIENASDKQDPATCIGTGSCFEMRTAAYIAMLISIIYRSLYCCMLTGIHRSMERVTSDFRRSCLASSSSVFIVAINTCNTLQWRRVRDTNSCERLITRSSGIRDK